MNTDKPAIVARLADVRARILGILEPLSDDDFRRPVAEGVGPIATELARIASFEEIWCLRRLGAATTLSGAQDRMLDAAATPARGTELPSRDVCFSALASVRAAVLAKLDGVDLAHAEARSTDPLVAGGLAWELAAQHEERCQETILESLALLDPGRYQPVRRAPLATTPRFRAPAILIPGGSSCLGSSSGFSEDAERPARTIQLPSFELDAVPATQGDLLAFVADDGYHRQELWTPEGWAWLEESGIDLPFGWQREPGGRMLAHRFDAVAPLDPDVPAWRLNAFEAEAYARWRGQRLPTEAEWEKAASWDPAFGCQRRVPWGIAPWTLEKADLDQLGFGPGPVACRPDGASAYGVLDMIGGVWEWTSSDFVPYPGFVPFPSVESSATGMNRGRRVLRGGSWATRPAVARASVRNHELPHVRRRFAGVRLARDV